MTTVEEAEEIRLAMLLACAAVHVMPDGTAPATALQAMSLLLGSYIGAMIQDGEVPNIETGMLIASKTALASAESFLKRAGITPTPVS